MNISKQHFTTTRNKNRALFLLIVWILLTLPLSAQSPPDAVVEFFISPELETPFTVGDQIKLRMEVTHPIDSRVALPQVKPPWGPFEVVEQTAPQLTDNGNGTAVTSKDIIISIFKPGQYKTPVLAVTHRKQDGSTEELATPAIPIQITSVLTETDTDLRELKAQAELLEPALWPWVLLSIFLATILIAILSIAGLWLYKHWQKRQMPTAVPAPVIDTRPPEIIALAELKRIEALNLPSQYRFKEHYSLIADCLRYYIEGRYQLPALEQTTDELKYSFRKSGFPIIDMNIFIDIFIESDLVKFARYTPNTDNANHILQEACVAIEATTPKPVPVKSPSPEQEELAK